MKNALLSESCELITDGTHASPARSEVGIPVLSAQNVNGGSLSYDTGRFTSQAEYDIFRKRLCLKLGDVLLTIVGFIGRSALVTEIKPAVFQRSVAVLRPNPKLLLSSYLNHALQSDSFQRQLLRATNQSSQAGVYLGKLGKLRIPLPTISEQQQIAALLDKADALRARRRASLQKVELLSSSLFLEYFGDPITNHKNWPLASVRDIGKVVTGNTPSREAAEYYGAEIEWVKSDNLNTPHYYITPSREKLSKAGKSVARIAPKGSILITCIAGSRSCIGNAAVADREVAFNQQINALIPKDDNTHFLFAQLAAAKSMIQTASTGGMKGMVSKSRLEAILLPVPPMRLQREFSKVVLKLIEHQQRYRHSLIVFESLFASLQHQAFRGEL